MSRGPKVQGTHGKGLQANQEGENNPASKLSNMQVRLIKERLKNGEDPKKIAPEFGVTYRHIMGIRAGRFRYWA